MATTDREKGYPETNPLLSEEGKFTFLHPTTFPWKDNKSISFLLYYDIGDVPFVDAIKPEPRLSLFRFFHGAHSFLLPIHF